MPTQPCGSALGHTGFFYKSDEELYRTAVSFVQEGVTRGEVVLVNAGAEPVTALLSEAFPDEANLRFQRESAYEKPVTVLETYRRLMDRGLADGVPGYRALGLIDVGNDVLPWQEWLKYEAAVNAVFADYPMQALCTYDLRSVPTEVADGLRLAHPTLEADGEPAANEGFLPTADLFRDSRHLTPPDALQPLIPTLVLPELTDLLRIRTDMYLATMNTGISRRRVDDFVTAVKQVATNALGHGVAPVEVRIWSTEAKVVCTVSDGGSGIEDPMQGYARVAGDTSQPLGLWAARQLCDVLDYSRGGGRFSVRLVVYQR